MDTIEIIKNYSGLKKSQISGLAQIAVEAVLETGNVLDVAESLSAMEDFIKSIKADKRFTDYVRDEAAKFGKLFTSQSGAKIELAEVGSKYDFSLCNDPELQESENHLIFYEKEVKDRKEFLKTIPSAGLDIITKDGEPIKIYPPSKTSTSSYKVTLSK